MNNRNDLDMLHFYIRQYEYTCNQISNLHQRLDDIQDCINSIYFQNENNIFRNRRPIHRNRNRDRDRNINSGLFSGYTNTNTNSTNPLENISQGTTNQGTNAQNIFNSFFDSIPIVPTREQIDNAVSVVNYRDISEPLNESCPICLERFSEQDSVSQINHCGHIFKSDQLTTWFQSNTVCPVCRYDIREGQPSNTNTQEETTNINQRLINRLSDYILYNSDFNRYTYDLSGNNINSYNPIDNIVYDASNNMLLFEAILRY